MKDGAHFYSHTAALNDTVQCSGRSVCVCVQPLSAVRCVCPPLSAYCGGLWLASACVMSKMAQLLEDGPALLLYRDILQRGSGAYDKLLWNGERMEPHPDSTPGDSALMTQP